MDSKKEFVAIVCEHYGISIQATMRNWFQYWNVPKDKLPKVVEMAQNFLFAQNQRERKALQESGFDFKNQD